MSHHSDQPALRPSDRQRMEIAAQQMQLGATGRQPLPPVSRDDRGEIAMGISHDAANRKVFLNFGEPIAWIGMTPEQALDLAESLIQHSRACRGIVGPPEP